MQVRSNGVGAVGFLGDRRRINVAVTRARKHVAIVCDSSTVSNNKFLLRFLQHIRKRGVVRHVDIESASGYMMTSSTAVTANNGDVVAAKNDIRQRSRA